MAITPLGLLGSGKNETSGTTLDVTNTSGAAIPAGTVLHLALVFDNHASTTAATTSLSNSGGSAWTAAFNPVGSGVTTTAGAGIWHRAWVVKTASSIASGATITTITFGSAVVGKIALVTGYADCMATIRGTPDTGTSTGGTPTATSTDPVSGDVVIGSIAGENSAVPTGDADTTNGSWATLVGDANAGGAANTNVALGVQWKVVSATGNQTYNATTSNDSVVSIVTLQPTISVTLGQATETDTSRRFGVPVGRASETDTVGTVSAPTLPGTAPGIFPEAIDFIGPIQDGNGNLYAITEETTATSNHARLVKSTNGGKTWAEMDAAGKPTTNDLEAIYLLQDREVTGLVHVLHQDSSDNVSYHTFGTSDHATDADQWITIDSGALSYLHDTTANFPVNQNLGMVQLSNGDIYAFYQADGEVVSTVERGRIHYKVSADNGATWSSDTALDTGISSTQSWGQLSVVLGKNDKIHLFAEENIAKQVHHRSLPSGGSWSSWSRVDGTTGTRNRDHPMTNAVYQNMGGVERIHIAWADDSNNLWWSYIDDDGTPSTPAKPTTTLVQVSALGNHSTLAYLVVNGPTLHCVYVDDSTDDIWHTKSVNLGSWSTPVELVDAVLAQFLFANAYTRAGKKILGYLYEPGATLEDDSTVLYNEVSLGFVVAVGQASETETVGVITPSQGAPPLVQVTETDEAQVITPTITRRYVAVGQVEQTATAQVVTAAKRKTIGQAGTAVTQTLLTDNLVSTDATSYTTASVAPAANKVLLLFTSSSHGTTDAPDPTVSGLGLTWTERANLPFSGTVALVRRIKAFTAVTGSTAPTPGTVTIDMGGATSTHGGWVLLELDADPTTPVVRTGSGTAASGTTGTVNLGGPAAGSARAFSFWLHRIQEAIEPRANWTELTDRAAGSPVTSIQSQWREDAFESVATASWTTTETWGGIALEIAAGSVSPEIAQPFTPSFSHNVAVNQASETDAPQAITATVTHRYVAVGQVSETDTAQVITPVLEGGDLVDVLQAAETETAQAFTTAKQKIITQASETAEAQPLSTTVLVGQNTETDTAQPITAQLGDGWQITVNQVVEADEPQVIRPTRMVSIGQASGGGSGGEVALVGVNSGSTGAGSGTNFTASAPAGVQSGHWLLLAITCRSVVGWTSSPTDDGFTLVRTVSDSAGEMHIYRGLYGTDVTTTSWDLVRTATDKNAWSCAALSGADAATLFLTENGQGESLSSQTNHSTPSISPAALSFLIAIFGDRIDNPLGWTWPSGWTERTDAYGSGTNAVSSSIGTLDANPEEAGSYSVTATAGVASSNAYSWIGAVKPGAGGASETAQPITVYQHWSAAVGQVAETDTAQPVHPANRNVTVGQVVETDEATTFTKIDTILGYPGQVTESDTAQPITVDHPRNIPVGQVSETDEAQAFTRRKTQDVGQVLERDGHRYAHEVMRRSPLGYWKLSESGLPLADSSGNGRSLTSVSGTPVYAQAGIVVGETDADDGALGLDGDGYVSRAANTDLTPATQTFAIWLDTTDSGTARGIASSDLGVSPDRKAWRLAMTATGYVEAITYNASGTGITVTGSTRAVNDGDSHLIVLVRGGSGIGTKVYVDGALEASDSTATAVLGTADFRIGNARGSYSNFIGTVDEAATWSGELSLADVQELYDAGSGGLLTALKTKSFGQNAETDAAQAITPTVTRRYVAVGQVAETDTAQAFSSTTNKLIDVTQVTETDTAQPVTVYLRRYVAVGQVTETETPQAIGRRKSKVFGIGEDPRYAYGMATPDLLTRSNLVAPTGTYDGSTTGNGYWEASPSADKTYDMRGVTVFAGHFDCDATSALDLYPTGRYNSPSAPTNHQKNSRPIRLGYTTPSSNPAVIGAKVTGDQLTTLGWTDLKHGSYIQGLIDDGMDPDLAWAEIIGNANMDGDPRVYFASGSFAVVDGVRGYNTWDCFGIYGNGTRTATGSAYIRNCWFLSNRDDGIENDEQRQLHIFDCLFEDAHSLISTRASDETGTTNSANTNTVENCVVQLVKGPGGHKQPSDVFTSGYIYKMQTNSPYLVMKNTIISMEGDFNYPEGPDLPERVGDSYENVTICWLGAGAYPGNTPSGVTVVTGTTAQTMIDDAIALWKVRHGVTDFDTVDMSLMLAPLEFEVDIARPMTPLKTRALGQPEDTETAQSITPTVTHRYVPMAAAVETDEAQPVSGSTNKLIPLATATEADTVGSVSVYRNQYRTVTQVAETDTANGVRLNRRVFVGQTQDLATAQPVTVYLRRYIPVTQITETDLAQAISSTTEKNIAVGQVTETDSLGTITPTVTHRYVSVGTVTETDAAQPVSSSENINVPVAQVTETDTLGALTARKSRAFGQAVELNEAWDTTVDQENLVAVGTAEETDYIAQDVTGLVAWSIRPLKKRTLGQLVEAETVNAISVLKHATVGQASEVDEAFTLIIPHNRLLGQAIETDSVGTIEGFGSRRDVVMSVGRAEGHLVVARADTPRTMRATVSGHELVASPIQEE